MRLEVNIKATSLIVEALAILMGCIAVAGFAIGLAFEVSGINQNEYTLLESVQAGDTVSVNNDKVMVLPSGVRVEHIRIDTNSWGLWVALGCGIPFGSGAVLVTKANHSS